MDTIAVIGTGNVASHLMKALSPHAATIQVNSRTLCGMPPHADLAIIAVSDKAVAEVAENIACRHPQFHGIISHTAGSVGIDAIPGSFSRRGVIYPMQTFSAQTCLDYSKIPFFIEASDENTARQLISLAEKVSSTVKKADSALRKRIHIASVLCCNFTNCLYTLADELLHRDGLDISLMIPLIEETVAKLERIPPLLGQTGPARRGDTAVIHDHISALQDYPDIAAVYSLLSDTIIRNYKKTISNEQNRLRPFPHSRSGF